MNASQVLNPPTYWTTLARNDALKDPNFCNQCKSWNLIALNVLAKTFAQLMDARISRFVSNTPGLLCAKGTRHLIRFARNIAFKDPLTLDVSYLSSLGSSFVIEIQAHARRI